MKMITEIKSDDQAINSLIDNALSFATLLGTPKVILKHIIIEDYVLNESIQDY